jgi:sulfonate transport system ATP-binding protein
MNGTQKPARAVVLREVCKAYADNRVLTGLDLTINRGEFVALLGASGSGKTTLLRILLGLEAPSAGEIFIPPVRTAVFQEPRLVPSMRVWRNVVIGQPPALATLPAATAALTEVGLARHTKAWPSTLSGGEAQRVALARALVRQPDLLLLDEPFASLDALTRLKMQALVANLYDRHRPAVLLVTHDVDEAILLPDRVLVLNHGAVSLDQPVDIPRPRRIGGITFNGLRHRLLIELGVLEERSSEDRPGNPTPRTEKPQPARTIKATAGSQHRP